MAWLAARGGLGLSSLGDVGVDEADIPALVAEIARLEHAIEPDHPG